MTEPPRDFPSAPPDAVDGEVTTGSPFDAYGDGQFMEYDDEGDDEMCPHGHWLDEWCGVCDGLTDYYDNDF